MVSEKLKLAAFSLVLIFLSIPVSASPIDLTAEKIYVRKGFEKLWVSEIPDGDNWLFVQASDTGKRPLRIRELGIPGVAKRTFLSPFSHKPEEFTFVTSFSMTSKMIHNIRIPGFFIKRIAFNWEIYLNGKLIHREMHPGKDGTLERLCSHRNVLVDINPLYLRKGKNILAFRIIGDPTHLNTGFLPGGPYLIDEYKKLDHGRSEAVILVLVFMYLFVGFYHLLLFYNRRSEYYNLYFGLMIFAVFFYFLSRTHYAQNIVPDSRYLIRIEFISLFMLLPMAQHFFDYLLNEKISIVSRIILFLYGFFSLLIIPLPLSFADDILRIWQVTAIIPLGYVAGITIYQFINKAREYITLRGIEESRAVIIFKAMAGTVSGNLLIGVIIIFFTTLFDIADAVFFHYDILLSRYFFFIVILGMTVMLANRFVYVHNRIEILNRSLEEKVEDLNQANLKIGLSEEKYRVLVEGANDIIFSLDENLRFITANNSMKELLKVDPEKVAGMDFLQFIHDEGKDVAMNSEFVKKKAEELLRKKKSVRFKTELISLNMKEPVAMQVKLQYINVEGKDEIIGRASRETEDSLLKYFVTEKQQFKIENYLVSADEVSRRLTRNLTKFCSQRDVDFIRLALREIIVNAIEHGNLDIKFEDKSEAMIEGTYLDLIEERQKQAIYRDRRVTIEYLVNSKKVVYVIVDEGNGFDFKDQLNVNSAKANDEMLAHGRGILMAKNVFDTVEFIGRGNQVRLQRNFN